NKDIRWLDVTVDNRWIHPHVEKIDCSCDWAQQINCFSYCEPISPLAVVPNQRGKIAAFDIVHDEVCIAVLGDISKMNLDYSRMANPSQSHHFRLETSKPCFFIEKFRKELLNRDKALQPHVKCTVNDAHSPASDFRDIREAVAFTERCDKIAGITDHQKKYYRRLKSLRTQFFPSFMIISTPSPYSPSPITGTIKYSLSGSTLSLSIPKNSGIRSLMISSLSS